MSLKSYFSSEFLLGLGVLGVFVLFCVVVVCVRVCACVCVCTGYFVMVPLNMSTLFTTFFL